MIPILDRRFFWPTGNDLMLFGSDGSLKSATKPVATYFSGASAIRFFWTLHSKSTTSMMEN